MLDINEHNESLGATIENAAEFLPDDFEVIVLIERGGYSVKLLLDSEEQESFDGESIVDEIERAVARAVEIAKSF